MRLIRKIILFNIFLILTLLSLSSVSADVIVTGSNTTDEIQSVIDGSNDNLIFEGEFTNLSTIDITREIKISGNNAIIIRNPSTTGSLSLFNITSPNVIIENLIIKGYDQTIISNSPDLLIQNNQIESTDTAINITTDSDLFNVEIVGNFISTSRDDATAIHLSSGFGIFDNSISYNRILTNGMFITLTSSLLNFNNVAFANWFGSNTLDISKFSGINILSYYVLTATVAKNNGSVGDNWTINYGFYLNDTTETGEFYKLPFFQAQLFNESGGKVSERTAYDTGMWNIAIEHGNTTAEFTVVLDNQEISLGKFVSQKGQTNIIGTIEGVVAVGSTVTINAVLKDVQGVVLANKVVTMIFDNDIIETKMTDANGRVSFTHTFNVNGDHVFLLSFDGDDNYRESNFMHFIEVPRAFEPIIDPIIDENPVMPEDIDDTHDHTPATIDSDELDENSKASAAMQNTGNPLVLLAICLLLAIFVPGLVSRKRK